MNIIKAFRDLFPHESGVPFPDDTHLKRHAQWVRQREERRRRIPHGLTLHRSIEETLEDPITLSPDGRYITSGARDSTIRLRNPNTGSEVRALMGHSIPVLTAAWSASGFLASGAKDNTIRLWETETGAEILELTGHSRAVSALAWSPDENLLASGAEDKSVRIWDAGTGRERHAMLGHPRNVRCVAWSKEGQLLASGDEGGQIRLWNPYTGVSVRVMDAHANGVCSVAWSPLKESLLASGGNDAIVRLWDTQTGRQMHILEGHTRQVTNVAFSPDGRILVSQSVEEGAEVRFWRTDTWELLAILPICPLKGSFPLAFQATAPLLLTGGDTADEVCIWHVDSDVLLLGRKPTMQYSNAKVVLMGDSGVGKTGLFHVICGEPFRSTDSTHARHVFVLDHEVVPLSSQEVYDHKGMLRQRREILLWDLAGQPGYRVIHQLHLSEVTLALVVFDGRNEIDPFAGVYYWDRALRQAQCVLGQPALPLKKLLVAARIDRGGIAVSKERIDELVEELGFDGYIETSAKDSINIDELRKFIKETIQWDALPGITSNELFETIKSFLLERKQTGHILTRVPDLYSLLVTSYKIGPDSEELHAQFERCIALVESRDLIKRFRFGSFVLLQPEKLDAYASALVNSVRDEPDGLGSILEADAKRCNFRMPPDERIQDKEHEVLLLLAMIEDMLRQELALLERTPDGNYLVFPSEATRVNEEMPDPEGKTLIFEFEGSVRNIYATLTVRLSRSGLFRKKALWKDAITYTTPRVGGLCGLFLQPIGEGRARLTLFFDSKASEETRFHFEDYIENHLQRGAIPGSVRRFRLFICPEPSCREPIPHTTVLKRRRRGFDWLLCSNCGTRIDLADREERLSGKTASQTLEMDFSADTQRKLDVLRSTRREEVAISQGKKRGDYDLFLCYSPADRSAIKQIGDQLLDLDILPWLDEWEVQPGQDWRQVLGAQMASINAIAVFVGKDSPPPWNDPQADQLLRTFAQKREIVPVILPECDDFPRLPDYINESWIDMQNLKDPIGSLIKRITTQ
jgi:small GTP-binding protein